MKIKGKDIQRRTKEEQQKDYLIFSAVSLLFIIISKLG